MNDNLKKHSLKITVLKSMKTEQIFEHPIDEQVSHAPNCCTKLKEGQSFIIDKNGNCTQKFPCNWAWHDLVPVITTMQAGGHFVMKKHPGIQYSCCTDGTMPVIFKLEWISEDNSPTELEQQSPREGNIRCPLEIKVMKVMTPSGVYGHTPEDVTRIPEPANLKAGQIFLVTEDGKKPEGFPISVWNDLNRYVLSLQLGGNFSGFKKGVFYACSSDGLFPVFFRLERTKPVR